MEASRRVENFWGKKAIKSPKIHEEGGKVSDTINKGDGDTKQL